MSWQERIAARMHGEAEPVVEEPAEVVEEQPEKPRRRPRMTAASIMVGNVGTGMTKLAASPRAAFVSLPCFDC